jgi:hypothetical protein
MCVWVEWSTVVCTRYNGALRRDYTQLYSYSSTIQSSVSGRFGALFTVLWIRLEIGSYRGPTLRLLWPPWRGAGARWDDPDAQDQDTQNRI